MEQASAEVELISINPAALVFAAPVGSVDTAPLYAARFTNHPLTGVWEGALFDEDGEPEIGIVLIEYREYDELPALSEWFSEEREVSVYDAEEGWQPVAEIPVFETLGDAAVKWIFSGDQVAHLSNEGDSLIGGVFTDLDGDMWRNIDEEENGIMVMHWSDNTVGGYWLKGVLLTPNSDADYGFIAIIFAFR